VGRSEWLCPVTWGATARRIRPCARTGPSLRGSGWLRASVLVTSLCCLASFGFRAV